jgi:hypothetical protein
MGYWTQTFMQLLGCTEEEARFVDELVREQHPTLNGLSRQHLRAHGQKALRSLRADPMLLACLRGELSLDQMAALLEAA